MPALLGPTPTSALPNVKLGFDGQHSASLIPIDHLTQVQALIDSDCKAGGTKRSGSNTEWMKEVDLKIG